MKDFGSAGASAAAFARASMTAPLPWSRHHRPISAPGFFSPCLVRYAFPTRQKSAFRSRGDLSGLGASSGVSAKGGSLSEGEARSVGTEEKVLGGLGKEEGRRPGSTGSGPVLGLLGLRACLVLARCKPGAGMVLAGSFT